MPRPAGFHRVPNPAPPTAAELGLAVREQREAADWSQEQLADAAGLTQRYISAIETGRHNPSVAVAASIAAAFHMRLSELIARAERGR
jgi:putative transcriptional regulator